jgi:TrmH family RNA methyltransferase
VIGTTRRSGSQRGAFLSFDDAISKVLERSSQQGTGIVFGRESKGLANEESALCDYLVTIPTGDAYPSLNLAQAVMVLLFALSWSRGANPVLLPGRALNKKEIEVAIAHFEEALKILGYKSGGADLLPRILKTFRGLIKRSGLLEAEAQMIKGLSRKIREKVSLPH